MKVSLTVSVIYIVVWYNWYKHMFLDIFFRQTVQTQFGRWRAVPVVKVLTGPWGFSPQQGGGGGWDAVPADAPVWVSNRNTARLRVVLHTSDRLNPPVTSAAATGFWDVRPLQTPTPTCYSLSSLLQRQMTPWVLVVWDDSWPLTRLETCRDIDVSLLQSISKWVPGRDDTLAISMGEHVTEWKPTGHQGTWAVTVRG